MRESIGSTWVFQLVIIFILIFVSFLILTLTYSKAFKNKNEMINIIEKHEGITEESVRVINDYLRYNGYNATHTCPENWYGIQDISDADQVSLPVKVSRSDPTKYYYCVRRLGTSRKSHYELKIFYRFSLPVIENIGTFTINGSTGDVFPADNDLLEK